MTDLLHLPARRDDGAFRVVVESPRGSQVKLKYEPEHGVFIISRPLILGLTYPYDWGFIPSTRAPDGDPLDAMLLWETPTYPGVVVPARAVGVVRVEQDGKEGRERNDRVIAMPLSSARGDQIRDVGDIAERVREELERFFVVVTGFSKKNPRVLGWGNAREGEELIDRSRTTKKKKK